MKKEKVQLSPEELMILDAFEKSIESGKINSIPNVEEEIQRFKVIANAAGNKAKPDS